MRRSYALVTAFVCIVASGLLGDLTKMHFTAVVLLLTGLATIVAIIELK